MACDHSQVVDKTGEQHATENVTGFPLMRVATLDIDRTFVHCESPRTVKLKLHVHNRAFNS